MTSKDHLAEIAATLAEIASSLKTLVPGAEKPIPVLGDADAYHWDGDAGVLMAVPVVSRVPLAMLKGIDAVQDILLRNTEQFARGHGANNALLWGARGMGKSSCGSSKSGLPRSQSLAGGLRSMMRCSSRESSTIRFSISRADP